MPKPLDAVCRAVVDTDKKGKAVRCENEIVFDTETDSWQIWCKTHSAADKKAAKDGGERVVRVG